MHFKRTKQSKHGLIHEVSGGGDGDGDDGGAG
jgi:hypothetical protein